MKNWTKTSLWLLLDVLISASPLPSHAQLTRPVSRQPVQADTGTGIRQTSSVEGKWLPDSNGASFLVNMDSSGRYTVRLADLPPGQESVAAQVLFDQVQVHGQNIKFQMIAPAGDQYKSCMDFDLTVSEDGKSLAGQARLSMVGAGIATSSSSAVIKAMNAELAKKIVNLSYKRQHYDPLTVGTPPASEAAFEGVPFENLLACQDTSLSAARARNHALLNAKNQSLPTLLRDKKNADLAALTTRTEQVILDLNHESEICKDRAQQGIEQNSARGNDVAELREFALAYKERIEILKPILAAIKEEIANRNK